MNAQRIDLTFVATNQLDLKILLDEKMLFQSYLVVDSNGFIGLESAAIDSEFNLNLMLKFIFGVGFEEKELFHADYERIIDLTEYRSNCMNFKELDESFKEWIEQSGRESNMDEYGNLLGIIGYTHRNIDKDYLLLIARLA